MEKPILSMEEVRKYQEMSQVIAKFRKTLAPRRETVVEGLKKGIFEIEEILQLMEYDGKESSNYDIEVDGVPITVRFSLKKTG